MLYKLTKLATDKLKSFLINYGGSSIDREGYWPRWMQTYDTLWGILAKGGLPSLSIGDPNKKIMKFKKNP